MEAVRISPKYQVVIPKGTRDRLGLKPGQLVNVIEHDGRMEFVPVRDVSQMRGFLKGIDTTIIREGDDE